MERTLRTDRWAATRQRWPNAFLERVLPMMGRLTDVTLGAVGRAIWHLGLAPLVWAVGGRNPKVILYHACEPLEGAFIRDLDVNTPPDVFKAQLDFFAKHYQVISVADLESGELPHRSVVITFDDGYRSVIDHAAPLLLDHGFSATVYLVTDVVGNNDLVWVNELNWLLLQRPDTAPKIAADFLGVPTPAMPSTLISTVLNRYERATLSALLDALWTDSPVNREQIMDDLDLYMAWDQVRELRACGWSFGSHTETHPNLRNLDRAELENEIGRSIRCIERELGEAASFAYPFGFDNTEVSAYAEGLGLRSIMVVNGTNSRLDPLRIARTSVTAAKPAQIFSELEVIAPAKAFVRTAARRVRRRSVEPLTPSR